MTRQPTQPAADRAQPVDSPARRRLLNGLWLALSGIALAEVAWLVGSFLKPLKLNGSPDHPAKIFDAGPTNRFVPGSVTAFPQGRFYLACLADGGFLALSRRCTHLGCTVPVGSAKRAVRLPLPCIRVRHPRRCDPVPCSAGPGHIYRFHREQPRKSGNRQTDSATCI
jgi:hypothetical protein